MCWVRQTKADDAEFSNDDNDDIMRAEYTRHRLPHGAEQCIISESVKLRSQINASAL